MATEDNPAGRLYNLINCMRHVANDGNQPMSIVMELAYNLPSGDTPGQFRMLSHMFELVANCKESVSTLRGVNKELYFQPLDIVVDALAKICRESTWNTFNSRVNEQTMTSLQFMSDMLSASAPETVVDRELLADIQADAEGLLERILVSNLPSNLKTALVETLEEIRRAIIDYRIFGGKSIKSALDASLGSLFRYQDEIVEVNDIGAAEEKNILVAFSQLFAKLDQLFSFGLKLVKIAAPIIFRILPPGNGS